MSNYGRLSEGLKIYRDTMRMFIAKRLRVAFPSGDWFDTRVIPYVPPQQASNLQRDLLRGQEEGIIAKGAGGAESVLDIHHFRQVIAANWDEAFFTTFKSKKVLNWVREVGDERNVWAHPPLGDLDPADANRVLDSCARVLEYVDKAKSEELKALRDGKKDVKQGSPPEDVVVLPPTVEKSAPSKASAPAAPKAAMTGLRPWRDVIAPRQDVQSGKYVMSEFAAHIGDVARGKAAPEYGDPKEFFRRTYVTQGMQDLLTSVVRRLRGEGGDPVLDLKTAFGGGKTHTMLAAYHLAKAGSKLADVPDVKQIYELAGGEPPKEVAVAVLVGTDLDPVSMAGRTMEETGGFEINTFWGEMAYQLAGHKGYKILQEHDAQGTAPGANKLTELFAEAGPSIILIDELVAYLRNLPSTTRKDVRSGNFNAHMTFCQSLSEAVSKTPGVVLLVSVPESVIEFGDARGQGIADQISNVFRRIGAPWQPVGAREAYEVVRRRLFADITDEAARDQTCEAFYKLYREGSDFPVECREPSFAERMRQTFPIHPEIFERLYIDWAGSVQSFQRTRGVLRLMADVIQRLWQAKDPDPMILPGSLPMYDPAVRQQLLGYLPENWNIPFDTDIDGDTCEAAQIERSNQRFGQVQACRRLTRTVMLGSVPGKAHSGLEVSRIMLGAALPGEDVSRYGDALRTLSGRLSYLYGTDNRYWFEVRPNLNKVASDRIARVTDEEAQVDIRRRLQEMRDTAEFAAVHAAPAGPVDVEDSQRARLVILGPESPHRKDDSAALKASAAILDSRGTTPRIHKNMLVFLAGDADSLVSVMEETKRYIGWHSIASDGKTGAINLDKGQQSQAEKQRDDASRTIAARLDDAYKWLLVPEQKGTDPVEWNVSSVTSGGLGSIGSLPQRASNKVVTDGLLITTWSPLLLKRELDEWMWKDGKPHIGLKQAWSYLTTYMYFSRLRDVNVLVEAVKNGVRTRDYFGYADGIEGERYLGLVFGEPARSVTVDDISVLVQPEPAAKQIAAETPEPTQTPEPTPAPGGGGAAPPAPAKPVLPRRFHASTKLNASKLASNAGQVGDEIVQHLNALVGSDVEVTIEVHASVPDGIPENVVRTVSENAKTLKFDSWGFEEE